MSNDAHTEALDELEFLLRNQTGPVLLPQPWHDCPHDGTWLDCVAVYRNLDTVDVLRDAIGYQCQPGHYAWIDTLAIASNAHQFAVVNAGSGPTDPARTHHHMLRFWMDERVRLEVKIDGVPTWNHDANVRADNRLGRDLRVLRWKGLLDDITPSLDANLAHGQVVFLGPTGPSYTPALPGFSYIHTNHPKGWPTHGLMVGGPVRRLLTPGQRLTVDLDSSAYDISVPNEILDRLSFSARLIGWTWPIKARIPSASGVQA